MDYKTIEENSKKRKTLYTELSIDQLKILLSNSNTISNTILVIKFGATWCGPCQKIKSHCYNLFSQTNSNILCFDIDIDNDINAKLYSAFKTKKMIKGVPTIMAYDCGKSRNLDHWYIPDQSVSGSDLNKISIFFNSLKLM
jgi:thiol-disulfide isomerase/thioredoxin